MSFKEENFGTFGSPPEKPPFFSLRRIFTFVFFAGVILALPLALSGWKNFYTSFAEKQAPKIKDIHLPKGLGLNTEKIEFTASDSLSGLSSILVKISQNGKSKVLLDKSFSESSNEQLVSINLNPKSEELEEGFAHLFISVSDSSYWRSSKIIRRKLLVDYEKPEIQMVSQLKEASQGGVGVVFYRAKDASLALSGVFSGETIYPGFRASLLDRSFSKEKDLFFAFFAISDDFDSANDSFSIFARDSVSNSSNISFNYSISKRPAKVFEKRLNEDLLKDFVDKNYELFLKQLNTINLAKPSILESEDFISKPKILLEKYQPAVELAAREFFSRPQLTQFWIDSFFQPGGDLTTLDFNATEKYFLENEALGQWVSPGVFFNSSQREPVRSAAPGKIIFADNFGLLGKTIIVDHGFGLSSMYSFLSEFSALEGAVLEKGQIIGVAGENNFPGAQAFGCLFQIRILGVPVRPEEWWAKKGMPSRFEKLVRETKESLGIESRQALQ